MFAADDVVGAPDTLPHELPIQWVSWAWARSWARLPRGGTGRGTTNVDVDLDEAAHLEKLASHNRNDPEEPVQESAKADGGGDHAKGEVQHGNVRAAHQRLHLGLPGKQWRCRSLDDERRSSHNDK